MKQVHQLRLFISCPSDIKTELDSIRFISEEINKTAGEQNGYVIECLNWKLDTYTQIGIDAQDVINRQVEAKYDILIGLLWQRIGSPTKRDKSGTIEEINRAIANNNTEKLIYFKTTPPDNLNLINLKELKKIKDFKTNLSSRGVLYKEFNSISEFEQLFRINLTNLIRDKILAKNVLVAPTQETKFVERKYQDISDLINEVELRSDDTSIGLDVFELSESMLSALNIVTSCLESMTETVNYLTDKLNERTAEINKYLGIKDERLRLAKGKIVVDLLAGELDEFNSRINSQLETFSNNLHLIGPSYTKIMQFASVYNINDTSVLNNSITQFRNSIELAITNTAKVLRVFLQWPVLTARFNKSKRETELTLKNITKEMLEGLKLLDEAIQ